jgi:hypothetical protein
MKYLKINDNNGNQTIINLSNITYFYEIHNGMTNICFGKDEHITVKKSIEEFELLLKSFDDINVYQSY